MRSDMHWQFNLGYYEVRCPFECIYGYHMFRGDLYGAYMAGGEL